MKYFVVVFCVAAAIELSRAETWMKNIPECKTKTGADDDYIKNIDFAIPKTKENACFLACVKKASKIFDENNKLNMDAVKEYFTNDKMFSSNKLLTEKIIEVFQICGDHQINEVDECLAAKELAKCIVPKKLEILKQMHIPLDSMKN